MPRNFQRRAWTDSEVERLHRMRREDLTFDEIGPALNRTPNSCRAKFYAITNRSSLSSDKRYVSPPAPPHLIEARDLRKEAAARRDYTATFCGDPPPGYSALDRKQTAPFHGTDARAQDHQRGSPK